MRTFLYLLIAGGLFLSNCSKKEDSASEDPNQSGTVSDIDGNKYKTVIIGTQVWMAENLKTTKYNDGTAIPTTTVNAAWAALTTGACGVTNLINEVSDDSYVPANLATYGRLYNWYAVNTGKLAPSGWHIPTNAEWTILTTFLGGQSVAGSKLKEAGTTHWLKPNKLYTNPIATNESGFTALPGGYRYKDGSYQYVNYEGYWWSSTEDSPNNSAWGRNINYSTAEVVPYNPLSKRSGFSVRCVKDHL
jgi:uncharacterized protein (TIGR02145 family)